MKKLNITINNIDYTIANTIKAQIIFENVSGKVFQLNNLTDVYIYYYCMIVANNENIDVDSVLPFDDFLSALDNTPHLTDIFNSCFDSKKKD